jgi:hypothetical protein
MSLSQYPKRNGLTSHFWQWSRGLAVCHSHLRVIEVSGESTCSLSLSHYRPGSRTFFGKMAFRNKTPKQNHGSFKKWLRYYLDFCEKYRLPASHQESLPEFLGNLREKTQTQTQRDQAACAVGMFYEMVGGKSLRQEPPAGLEGSDRQMCLRPHVSPQCRQSLTVGKSDNLRQSRRLERSGAPQGG